MTRSILYEACEVTGAPGPVVLTCEHASMRLPEPWVWPDADRRLVGTHWSYDLGATELTRELARELSCAAVLSRFTRLLVDPNRPLASETLFRTQADGQPIVLNGDLSDAERGRRIRDYYDPYHEALDEAVAAAPGALVFGVHSFTPVYEGRARAMELGVLFDRDEALGKALAAELSTFGYRTVLNEPWSGRAGLMYSPQLHADAHGRRALELEVRQDLCTDPTWRSELASRLGAALRAVGAC